MLRSQGFLRGSPGLEDEVSLPTKPRRFCFVSHEHSLASRSVSSTYPEAHPGSLCLGSTYAASGYKHPFLLLCLSRQVPVIWDHILKKNTGKWEAIAKHQVKHIFSPTEEELKLQARR